MIHYIVISSVLCSVSTKFRSIQVRTDYIELKSVTLKQRSIYPIMCLSFII